MNWVRLGVIYRYLRVGRRYYKITNVLKRPSNQDIIVLFSSVDYEGKTPSVSATLDRWYTIDELNQAIKANIRLLKERICGIK